MNRAIERVLIANRGEIAVRIMRSLRELGIETVAVYSDADADALHVRVADHAVRIGPAAARESYLSIERVLAAAQETGAHAIHPGYGFLAENEEFASACAAAGLVFIGPPVDAIRRMGDKAGARAIAVESGVPVAPGAVAGSDEASLRSAAADVGFPLLLKPSSGGGGKGMRVVHRIEDLVQAAAAGRREALAAFGDDTLILERFVRPARHVEVQVFADDHGNVVALGERECSLQRRHQKVIEECPSPVVDEDLRRRMAESAVALARRVDYRGAGTVEFLLGEDGEFFFLEMNTRLQVEHPVTELVYGVDLVKAQIAVARGEPLPAAMLDPRPRGHAIEARIYAEDPASGFLPTPGRVLKLVEPRGPWVRFDAALEDAGTVGADYDPMIAKLAVWGVDRREATARLVRALEDTAVLGITTNVAYLLDLARQPWFADADFHTRTLEERIEETAFREEPISDEILAAAVHTLARWHKAPHDIDVVRPREDGESPFDAIGEWRLLMRSPRS